MRLSIGSVKLASTAGAETPRTLTNLESVVLRKLRYVWEVHARDMPRAMDGEKPWQNPHQVCQARSMDANLAQKMKLGLAHNALNRPRLHHPRLGSPRQSVEVFALKPLPHPVQTPRLQLAEVFTPMPRWPQGLYRTLRLPLDRVVGRM